ncbi:hypothetical protein J6590_039754 [Homalodisca vitripennis]|nr:hypothetical protein J6590_039754 [Homalodisca vitripennis]
MRKMHCDARQTLSGNNQCRDASASPTQLAEQSKVRLALCAVKLGTEPNSAGNRSNVDFIACGQTFKTAIPICFRDMSD